MKSLTRLVCALSIVATLSAMPPTADAATPGMSKAVAARVKRDAARCRAHANVDACDDALRWSPSDPALLTAYGDALLRARRAPDALRQYQRAANLAPMQPGLKAKIAAAEKSSHTRQRAVARRAPAHPAAADAGSRTASTAVGGAKGDHYSNAAPETQSH